MESAARNEEKKSYVRYNCRFIWKLRRNNEEATEIWFFRRKIRLQIDNISNKDALWKIGTPRKR